MLPKNEKVVRNLSDSLKLYLYGASFTGKTTFASKFPDALIINTDGNIKYIDTPATSPKSWLEFKNTVADVVAGKHTFKTVIIDLVEDIYTLARIHWYKELKITHESDLGYAKAYDIIRTDFLGEFNKLLSDDRYNVILISHEDSKTVKNRVGIEKEYFMPNLSDKVAKKLAGMVDIAGRFYVEYDAESECDKRYINISPKADEFGGFRTHDFKVDRIGADYEELKKLFK